MLRKESLFAVHDQVALVQLWPRERRPPWSKFMERSPGSVGKGRAISWLLRHPSHHPGLRCRTDSASFQITSSEHKHGGFARFIGRCRSSGSLAVRRVVDVSSIHSGWPIDARFIGLWRASPSTSSLAYYQGWQHSGNGATICHDISKPIRLVLKRVQIPWRADNPSASSLTRRLTKDRTSSICSVSAAAPFQPEISRRKFSLCCYAERQRVRERLMTMLTDATTNPGLRQGC
jgi:hypothetical protein